VLGEYMTAESVRARYQALGDWYEARNHFWVGNGPYYLDSVHTVEKILTLKRFEDFNDSPDKWMRFASPRFPEVAVDGPNRVNIGEATTFEVAVNFEGSAYPNEDIGFVKFLVFDSRGELAISEVAQATAEGKWQISLTSEQTQALSVGSNQMEVIVASNLISLPIFETINFVTVNPS
jgi:peptide/nickel transport system substrate-binding protein